MDVNRRAAPVEFGKDRGEIGMSQPAVAIAGHQPDPGRPQVIERKSNLDLAGLDVRHRQKREQFEPARVIAAQVRRESVDPPHHAQLGGFSVDVAISGVVQ